MVSIDNPFLFGRVHVFPCAIRIEMSNNSHLSECLSQHASVFLSLLPINTLHTQESSLSIDHTNQSIHICRRLLSQIHAEEDGTTHVFLIHGSTPNSRQPTASNHLSNKTKISSRETPFSREGTTALIEPRHGQWRYAPFYSPRTSPSLQFLGHHDSYHRYIQCSPYLDPPPR